MTFRKTSSKTFFNENVENMQWCSEGAGGRGEAALTRGEAFLGFRGA